MPLSKKTVLARSRSIFGAIKSLIQQRNLASLSINRGYAIASQRSFIKLLTLPHNKNVMSHAKSRVLGQTSEKLQFAPYIGVSIKNRRISSEIHFIGFTFCVVRL